MANRHSLTVRVEPAMRERIRQAAEIRFVTEAAWIRHAIIAALGKRDADEVPATVLQSKKRRDKRLSVKLRPDDRRNLADRAELRGMPELD